MRIQQSRVVALVLSTVLAVFSANVWEERDVTVPLPPGAGYFMPTDGYSNSVWDDSTGTVYGRTGVGYGSGPSCRINPGFYSNAFVAWKPLSDTARIVNVQTWGGAPNEAVACITDAWLADTAPLHRHFYDGFTYCRENHSIYLVLGAYGRIQPAADAGTAYEYYMLDDTASTWRYAIGENKWHRIRSSIRKFWPSEYTVSNYESHLRYWPEGKKLLFVDNAGTHLAEFDIVAETWTNISAAGRQSPFSLYNCRSCWDSKRSLWIFRQDSNVCAYDPAQKSFRQLPSCGVAGTGAAEKGAFISYDSRNDCYLVTGSDSRKTRYFTYRDSTWKRPLIADSVALPFPGYLTYDSSRNVHLLTYQHSFWTFTLDTSATTALETKYLEQRAAPYSVSANPFHGRVKITADSPDARILITDLAGRKVAEGAGASFVWNAQARPAGVYLVKLAMPGFSASCFKIICR